MRRVCVTLWAWMCVDEWTCVVERSGSMKARARVRMRMRVRECDVH